MWTSIKKLLITLVTLKHQHTMATLANIQDSLAQLTTAVTAIQAEITTLKTSSEGAITSEQADGIVSTINDLTAQVTAATTPSAPTE